MLGLRFDALPRAAWVALGCSLAALWLLGRRYAGFLHDAPLYVAQALRRLDPASFDADLFFAHGSQDAYTLFPRLYAPLTEALGIGGAALAVVVAGQLALAGAAFALVARIVPPTQRWWSLALLAVTSGFYGGVGTFRIAEPFASARSLAEPLVLGALACVVHGRPLVAYALLAMAGLLHPLVAATGLAVVLVLQTWQRPRVAAAVGALALLAGFLVALWPGSPRLDPEWRAIVQARSPHLLLAGWLLPDWSRVAWGFGALWLAACLAPAVRQLALAVAVCGAAGIVLTGVGVDLMASAVAAALQPWRAHWLVQLLATLLIPVAAGALWSRGGTGRVGAACIVASCCFGREGQPVAALLVLAAVVLERISRRRPDWLKGRAERVTLVAVLTAAAAGLMLEVQSRLPPQYIPQETARWEEWTYAVASAGGLLPLALILWLLACSRFYRLGLVLALGALALAMLSWDGRSPWRRFLDDAVSAPGPFQAALAPGSVVFWPGAHSPAWLVLRRANWYGADQGAGIVFSRDTALAWAERKRAAAALVQADEDCRGPARSCGIDSRLVQELCGRADAPTHVVLPAPVANAPVVEWRPPTRPRPAPAALYLHACSDIVRQGGGRK